MFYLNSVNFCLPACSFENVNKENVFQKELSLISEVHDQIHPEDSFSLFKKKNDFKCMEPLNITFELIKNNMGL